MFVQPFESREVLIFPDPWRRLVRSGLTLDDFADVTGTVFPDTSPGAPPITIGYARGVSNGTTNAGFAFDHGIDNFSATVRFGGCNIADLAAPADVLDLSDVDAFVAGFTAADPIADLAEPFGTIDLSDIDAFITAFLAGCP